MDNLAGASVVLVCVSVLMFVASLVVDRCAASGRIHVRVSRSMLMMRPRNVAILLLTYAAIAFSQDMALEWLASIAVLVCCSASLVRRGVAAIMSARGGDGMADGRDDDAMDDATADEPDGDGEPSEAPSPASNGSIATPGHEEERPLVVAGRMAEMFSDILIYVSAADLILLFVMALVEKVIPYYVGLAIG